MTLFFFLLISKTKLPTIFSVISTNWFNEFRPHPFLSLFDHVCRKCWPLNLTEETKISVMALSITPLWKFQAILGLDWLSKKKQEVMNYIAIITWWLQLQSMSQKLAAEGWSQVSSLIYSLRVNWPRRASVLWMRQYTCVSTLKKYSKPVTNSAPSCHFLCRTLYYKSKCPVWFLPLSNSEV